MLRMSTLARWFPASRFIHIVRDGRDACLSQTKQDFGFDDVLPCAAAWREQVWWVREIGAILGPDRYFELRYEDLLEDPERWLRSLCRFLGVPFAEAMLRYHEKVDHSIPQSRRHLWPLLTEPPRKDNAGLWKKQMTAAQRVCFEKRAGVVLRQLDYETLESASGGYVEEFLSVARRVRKLIAHRVFRRK